MPRDVRVTVIPKVYKPGPIGAQRAGSVSYLTSPAPRLLDMSQSATERLSRGAKTSIEKILIIVLSSLSQASRSE